MIGTGSDCTDRQRLDAPFIVELFKALKAAHTIEAPVERTATRGLDPEEPVTTRIRGRCDGVSDSEPPEDAQGTVWRSLAASRREARFHWVLTR